MLDSAYVIVNRFGEEVDSFYGSKKELLSIISELNRNNPDMGYDYKCVDCGAYFDGYYNY